jgi:peptidyl-prolyl cis-trans isomerase B (cyclophilin B)
VSNNPLPLVTIELDNGATMEAELYPDIAPNTVNSFISLISKGFYDGLTFHRVIPGFVIQGGCPEGIGTGGPGYRIRGEFADNGFKNDLKHVPGVLSMARSGRPDSAGSQFFIMLGTSPHLDGGYAAFGKVVSGYEEAERIASVPCDRNDKPLSPQRMKKVTVELFGVEYPEPEILSD